MLDYPYSKENYKMIAIELSTQRALDANPRAIQQINFTANLDRAENTAMFLIIEEAKETVFCFFNNEKHCKFCKFIIKFIFIE